MRALSSNDSPFSIGSVLVKRFNDKISILVLTKISLNSFSLF